MSSSTSSPIIRKSSPVAGVVVERDREVVSDERPERMRDWIVRMVNSGRFHGLEWINPEKTIFRVPWIHAKKRGYCKDRDAALFREWAIHSGKYRDESDPTVWKINFRCAINGLKDIMEIKDLQTEDCRVYKVLPSRSKRRKPRHKRPDPYEFTPEVAVAPHIYEPGSCTYLPSSVPEPIFTMPSPPFPRIKTEFKPELPPPCSGINGVFPPVPAMAFPYSCISSCGLPTTLTAESNGCYCSAPCDYNAPSSTYNGRCDSLSSVQMENGFPLQPQGSPDSGINDAQHSPLATTTNQPSPEGGYYGGMMTTMSAPSPAYSTCSSPNATSSAVGSPQSSINAVDDEEISNIIKELSDPTSTPGPSPVPSPPPQQLELQVYYGSIPVFKDNISVYNGCRIFFDPRFSSSSDVKGVQKLFGPSDLQQIDLPECHPNPYASDIFKAMSRGLIIEMNNDDIYVTPLCRTVVYYGQRSTSQSCPLQKEQRVKVFDYTNQFRPELERYALSNGQPPSSKALFSLGQPWGPSCPAGHISQTLISVCISHTKAQMELNTIGLPIALTQDCFLELPDSIDIGRANMSDLEAEAFLTQCMPQHVQPPQQVQ